MYNLYVISLSYFDQTVPAFQGPSSCPPHLTLDGTVKEVVSTSFRQLKTLYGLTEKSGQKISENERLVPYVSGIACVIFQYNQQRKEGVQQTFQYVGLFQIFILALLSLEIFTNIKENTFQIYIAKISLCSMTFLQSSRTSPQTIRPPNWVWYLCLHLAVH